jgi:hypothetical protein
MHEQLNYSTQIETSLSLNEPDFNLMFHKLRKADNFYAISVLYYLRLVLLCFYLKQYSYIRENSETAIYFW